MKRDDTFGVYGYHPELNTVIQEIKEHSRGIEFAELEQNLELAPSTIKTVLTQAEALGKIVVEGSEGKPQRFYYTDHRNLHINTEETTREELEDQLSETLDDLYRENSELRIDIQQIEG